MKYYNRYTQTIEEEKVPGKFILTFLYHTKCGALLLFLCFKRAWSSRLCGWWMHTRWSRHKIIPFAKKYNIALNLFEKKPQEYENFNDFFCRKFKPGQRTFSHDKHQVCFPADGRHLGFQSIEETRQFFVKGQALNLEQLLGNKALAQHFRGATCVISRLSPVDYHRFHFPCAGVPHPAILIPGVLYSVSPIALRQSSRIFGENKRMLTLLHTEYLGQVAMVEVGACNVGSIQQTFLPHNAYKTGDEKGYFLFGGSTIVTLFEYNRVRLAEDLRASTQRGLELYAHVGDILGSTLPNLNQRYPDPEF